MAAQRYQERYEGAFAGMNFPPYKYEEFPKWVKGPNGPVIVQNMREELDLQVTTLDASSDPNSATMAEAAAQAQNDAQTAREETKALSDQLKQALAEIAALREAQLPKAPEVPAAQGASGPADLLAVLQAPPAKTKA